MPRQAVTDEEIMRCYPVMAELRPHLKSEAFLPQVREMEAEGFRLAYIDDKGRVVAVAGYRICTNLFMGRNLYVDDLVTSENARSNGHGEAMLSWLRSLAVAQGCRTLHLDSGTQRQQAHKFYFRQGMVITSFHFAEQLDMPD